MSAKVFHTDAPLGERRVIIRRHDGDVEMVELPWGLRPRDGGPSAVNVIRSEGRTFPTHRCLVPASEFRRRSFSFYKSRTGNISTGLTAAVYHPL